MKNYKEIFKRFEIENGFVKETAPAIVDTSRKAALNRKGNVLYNSGDIETARRIFLTTGYTDGLVRIGDYYRSKSRMIDALRMYWIAPDKKKSEPIIERISDIVHQLLTEDER